MVSDNEDRNRHQAIPDLDDKTIIEDADVDDEANGNENDIEEERLQTDGKTSESGDSNDQGRKDVDEEDSDEREYAPIRPPRGRRRHTTPMMREIAPNIHETRDRLSMQSHNVLIFTNVKRKPRDEGSKELADVSEIPEELTFSRSTVIPYRRSKRCIIAAPEYRDTDLVSVKDIRETLASV